MTDEAMNEAPDLGSDDFVPEGDTLSDQLSSAWDHLAESDKDDADEDTAEGGSDAESGDEQSEKDQAAAQDQQESTPEPEQAPQHWSDDAKAKFAALPPEAKALALDMAKAQEADYTRKTQELAEQRGQYEPLMQAVEPYKQYLSQVGVTPDAAFNVLIGTEQALRTGTPEQKLATLQQLASNYGVPLEGQSIPADAYTKQLQQTVQRLEQRLQSFEEHTTQQVQKSVTSEIDQFANAKTEDGKPAHPYFDQVGAEMARLIRADDSLSLKDAYEQAIWANPEIRSQLIQQQAEADAAKKAAAARAAKEKADDKTRRTPSGEQGKPTSIADAASLAWEQASGR